MKQPMALLGAVAAALGMLDAIAGQDLTLAVALGAISVMAAMISATFLWLRQRRETPLALGMAFSWAGAASIPVWWWAVGAWSVADTVVERGLLYGFLSLYFVGAVMHFTVMRRSMGISAAIFAAPVLGAIVVASLVS